MLMVKQETQHWVLTATDCEYINSKQQNDLNNKLAEIGRMLKSL